MPLQNNNNIMIQHPQKYRMSLQLFSRIYSECKDQLILCKRQFVSLDKITSAQYRMSLGSQFPYRLKLKLFKTIYMQEESLTHFLHRTELQYKGNQCKILNLIVVNYELRSHILYIFYIETFP